MILFISTTEIIILFVIVIVIGLNITRNSNFQIPKHTNKSLKNENSRAVWHEVKERNNDFNEGGFWRKFGQTAGKSAGCTVGCFIGLMIIIIAFIVMVLLAR